MRWLGASTASLDVIVFVRCQASLPQPVDWEPRVTTPPFLSIGVCAAGIAGDAHKLITAAQDKGWGVGVVATPQGLGLLDTEAIEAQTGYPIRSAWRSPGAPLPLPPADAIAVAPATFDTINKWAAGIADTLALGILCEAYGMGIPTAVLPYVNTAMAAHPAYGRSLNQLREMGVLVGSHEPHRPKTGGGADRFRGRTRWNCWRVRSPPLPERECRPDTKRPRSLTRAFIVERVTRIELAL